MQKTNVMVLSLLAVFYAGQVLAADSGTAVSTEKVPVAAKKKTHTHKKDCVEKPGTPCPLHDQKAASATNEVKPAVASITAVSAAAIAVPAAIAAPEVKAEPVVSEADALALAKKNNCLTCHAIDKKIVGPAWKEVATKYRGDAAAEAKLSSKISTGGAGVWGSMAMPANPKLSEADRKTLAKFVLSLK